MNERSASYDSSRNEVENGINSTMITMQIQALRKSLRRLVDQDDRFEVELLGTELKEAQSKPNC